MVRMLSDDRKALAEREGALLEQGGVNLGLKRDYSPSNGVRSGPPPGRASTRRLFRA